MNKKLFAMMMVPVIVVMGGTFAFSAWSGSTTSVFNESTATFSYTQNITFEQTNANLTPLTVSGTNNLGTDVTYMTPAQILDPTTTGTTTSGVVQYANVSNLVPGDIVVFHVAVKNTGTSTLNLSSVKVYNADGQELQITTGSGSTISSSGQGQTVNMSSAFLPSVSMANAVSYMNSIPGSMGLIGGALPGVTSVPQYLTPGQTFTYVAYLVVGSDDSYGHAGFGISINIASAV